MGAALGVLAASAVASFAEATAPSPRASLLEPAATTMAQSLPSQPARALSPVRSTSEGSTPAIPTGYGSPLFVQQLSAMVASLESQNIALQERERAAKEREGIAVAAERDEEAHSRQLQETVDSEKQARRPSWPRSPPCYHAPICTPALLLAR